MVNYSNYLICVEPRQENIYTLLNAMPENDQVQITPSKPADAVSQLPKEPNSFLKNTRWLLLFLLVVILLIGATVIYQNQQLKKQVAETQISPNTPSISSPVTTQASKYEFYPRIKAEFQKIAEKYQSQVLETAKLGIGWISQDNLNIINDDSSGFELRSFNCEKDVSQLLDFKEIAQSASSKIDLEMRQNGFNLNQKNSSTSIADNQFHDYVQAYEKGTTKCAFVASPNCGGTSLEGPMYYTFSLGCTEDFDKNYQQQAPYLTDLGIDKAVIHVQQKVGDFVKLNVNERRSGHGHYTVAKLINGKWKELFSGQDIPTCEALEKNAVPKEIMSECYPSNPQN
ncbi:MAG: hypothetical protein UV61_C0006G0130 [Candidatus Gottesmanbacteria bacterium GW2011_GWB1_43_11]|uniref:Uncharacterized protein n=1 Tax=Candidatus Gottesmanbacteria bacterium GW2011_GWB1_43_11 TaxID=1618446 RepID=A0A0G1CN09_9BACT|nr:MAG: hypothetical protein UV04_C0005G0128 [Candidatus Gottesmanbacteria bacterium GW2011_GWA2_42_16]KKS55687.1 MAG: hypothetical protein UV17_C0008G0038 [Candidatus Gottesmanbacteria bacterium GW2011_GWA1_42_26]KKS81462.1 MAG: hypothetical protein UV55_C0013G0004 [Candidatus Gottesmanbacteria bacterium GW2011_GWC1_43_10]KKS86929.1 MAG: hypothetical protein UV61_C0006G0130 [Candidatus Gottesmanbacteria bacterium GW2011_GWB1_43_11]